jgi:glucose/arabinose dehydrogenase
VGDIVKRWRAGSLRTIALMIALMLITACAAPVGDSGPAAPQNPTEIMTATPEAQEPAPTEPPAAPTADTEQPAAQSETEPTATEMPMATATVAPTAAAATATSGAPRQLTLAPVTEAQRPIYVASSGDGTGRLFVVEKRGTIVVLQDGKLAETPFLDLCDRVKADSSEQGLLGLAFAPNFEETGYFFVNYTDARGDTVISRFSAGLDADAADPNSEFLVLGLDQPAPNHNGGNLVFGPDGYLWIGMGDGGAANDRFRNGQNPDALLGKMLRIDVTTDPSRPYLVPQNNPWVSTDWNGQDVRDEVWAVGLRNPWRYSFDRETSDLWIGDVGQNQYEEIDRVAAGSPGGLNFGWPLMEGTHCFSGGDDCDRTGLEIPVAEYEHTGHCSVTGGYVYRGKAIPELVGTYVFGDYCSGVIWGLTQQADGQWQSRELLATNAAISSFAEDEDGELFVLDLEGGIYRLGVE